MRIISVVPSLTELLIDLGLENQLVGVTRFCIHPNEKTKLIQNIGGTKKLKIKRIIDLKPDLIIANKEENSKDDILQLQQYFEVLITDIFELQGSLNAIAAIGYRTNKTKEAAELIKEIEAEFKSLQNLPKISFNNTAYLIWDKPIMLAGKNTFINNLMELMGIQNINKEPRSRYPIYELNELQSKKPDLIFLSSEPYPFAEKHLEKFKTAFPNSKILLVDGEMFSWYGSRLKLAPSYFKNLHQQILA